MPTVLITGANRGLGQGFVQRFGGAGWRVIATCRDPGAYDGDALAVDALAPIRIAAALADNVAASERRQMVFISSIMGSITQSTAGGAMIYRSAKACLNAAVNVLGHDLAPRGIGCTMFHPGWVRTGMGGPGAAIDVQVSAHGIFNVIDRLTLEDSGRFINYDGFDIPW